MWELHALDELALKDLPRVELDVDLAKDLHVPSFHDLQYNHG